MEFGIAPASVLLPHSISLLTLNTRRQLLHFSMWTSIIQLLSQLHDVRYFHNLPRLLHRAWIRSHSVTVPAFEFKQVELLLFHALVYQTTFIGSRAGPDFSSSISSIPFVLNLIYEQSLFTYWIIPWLLSSTNLRWKGILKGRNKKALTKRFSFWAQFLSLTVFDNTKGHTIKKKIVCSSSLQLAVQFFHKRKAPSIYTWRHHSLNLILHSNWTWWQYLQPKRGGIQHNSSKQALPESS